MVVPGLALEEVPRIWPRPTCESGLMWLTRSVLPSTSVGFIDSLSR